MSVDFAIVEELELRLEVKFENPRLLIEAITHRSWCNEQRYQGGNHNERLEFLGDAVLELCVTRHLMEAFPQAAEGELTNIRSALVRNDSLVLVAQKLELMNHLRMSRGEAKDQNPQTRQRMAACLVEALIGAIYQDQGFESAWRFVQEHVIASLAHILENGRSRDAKSQLQELTQAQLGATPEYRHLGSSGPDHDRVHVAGVFVQDEVWGEGKGSSTKEAQKEAAQEALRSHFGEPVDESVVLPEVLPPQSSVTPTSKMIPVLAFLGRSTAFRALGKDVQAEIAQELAQ